MVPRTELEHEVARARATQRELADSRKQVAELKQQLAEARAQVATAQSQLAAAQNGNQPRPTDRDQILQVLAPVLKASNGRP